MVITIVLYYIKSTKAEISFAKNLAFCKIINYCTVSLIAKRKYFSHFTSVHFTTCTFFLFWSKEVVSVLLLLPKYFV